MRTPMRYLRGTVLVLVLAVMLAACGGDGDTEDPGATPTEDGDAATDPGTDGATPTETATDGEQAGGEGCEGVDLASAPDEPVTVRIGHGVAAEEPFWLMTVDPSLTEHQGSWYEIDMQQFRGTEERLQAYQAGQLDAVVVSPQAQIRGTARGALDLYAIGTIMREAEPDAFSTSFMALEDSGISSLEDLQGKKIGIVDTGSHLDFLARLGVEQGGGDPDTGAEYIVFPFPAQEEALRGGQLDVAGLPEPFFSLAMANGGVQKIYDASDLTDFAYDLLTLSFDRQFVENNLGVVCAFAADYEAAMEEYRTNKDSSRSKLAASDFIPLPEDVYLQIGDYARPEGGVVDTEGMQQMLDLMIEQGILEEQDRVDPATLVLPGVSLGH